MFSISNVTKSWKNTYLTFTFYVLFLFFQCQKYKWKEDISQLKKIDMHSASAYF